MVTEIEITEISYTKKMVGWSKYGGARKGTANKTQNRWTCQACGKDQVIELPVYLIPEDESKREFFRVCSECKNVAVSKGIGTMMELIQAVRGNRLTD